MFGNRSLQLKFVKTSKNEDLDGPIPNINAGSIDNLERIRDIVVEGVGAVVVCLAILKVVDAGCKVANNMTTKS